MTQTEAPRDNLNAGWGKAKAGWLASVTHRKPESGDDNSTTGCWSQTSLFCFRDAGKVTLLLYYILTKGRPALSGGSKAGTLGVPGALGHLRHQDKKGVMQKRGPAWDMNWFPDVSVQSVLRIKGFAWSSPFPSVTADCHGTTAMYDCDMVRLSQYLKDMLKL